MGSVITPHTLSSMKRFYVFTPTTIRAYPPLFINPFDNPFVGDETSVVVLRFTLLLAITGGCS
jgi:hypothetical protein